MTDHTCTATVPAETLTAYWLDELDAAAQAGVEEHLFACASCSARLQALVGLADALRQATRAGRFHAVVSASFVKELQDDGLRVREYRMQPGGSVACTVGPDDDLVVAHLHAPLENVRRLDMVVDDLTAGTRTRVADVPFDPGAGEIVHVPRVGTLRKLTHAAQLVQLVSVEDSGDRLLGTYTFNHSPYEPGGS